ncbi:hypothetical protein [Natrinema halophilum]|uniref:Uncharacterized protein n=1 Tax=Natrinema halophilum TaxID=1699371 RepID=A0A7D5GFW2_9EURY|nr:hypothetical protein [Natrinema halophilum]QLG47868.1 hypothetical protein HYG82_02915 [Natrinema halophilum]
MELTGRDRITVEKDGEEVEVFNHASVSTHHYANSINGYDTFEPTVSKGDLGSGPKPEAVTPRLANVLRDEFHADVEDMGIDVIDPESEEVDVL